VPTSFSINAEDGELLSPSASHQETQKTRLLNVQERAPRPEQIDAFIQDLSSNDAKLVVIVGQGRLLTLKQNVLVDGRNAPLIAVGDPTIVDFDVVGPRHLRIRGQRIGVTDLSIITGDHENLSLEVHCIVDLDLLRAKLRQTFPDALLELTQLREQVVVGGEARSTRQVAQIIQMIKNYLNSA